jgi:adenylosuccinate synthase
LKRQIVLVSGPVGAGKTTLCEQLVSSFGAIHFKSRHYLLRRVDPGADPANPTPRNILQALGNKLDKKTKGAWIVDGIREILPTAGGNQLVLVDAVRIEAQIAGVRSAYGDHVVHIHLTAPVTELGQRYASRSRHSSRTNIGELKSYDDVRRDTTESRIDELATHADIVIDTALNTREDVLVRAASHLGLYGREYLRLCDVLVGGQYGSEGKGQVAAYLAREYEYLVRVGGPNAGHSVYAEPEPFRYHHLPSGTRHSNAKIVIGSGAVIRVAGILKEIGECGIEKDRLFIDPQAMVIEDSDREAEKDLKALIGSTGQGVGSATARRILHRGHDSVRLAKRLFQNGSS